ncbi:MAG: MerR family transcriptional regulator [Actinomycetota bacterium]
MTDRNGLVSIGRFSAMTRLSVKALRHYDDVGLLTPAEVDPGSGYRYYALGQAGDAEAIRVLRGLDVPLDEIAELLGSEPDELTVRLGRLRDRLEREVADRTRGLRFVEGLLSAEAPSLTYEVRTTALPDQEVVAIAATPSWTTMHDEIATGFGRIVEAITAHGIEPAGTPLILFHEVIDPDRDGAIELCVPVAERPDLDGAPDEPHSLTLRGGPAATTVHQGSYEEIAPAYHVLEGWLHEHGHVAAGSPRELYLSDPTTTPPEQVLTEVQVPIA